MTIHGVDASAWSGNLDIAAIAANEAFVYHQATDGVGMIDKLLMPRTNALRAAGMGDRLGAYAFLRVRHGHPQDADEQCKQFLDVRANAGCNALPPWLDVELGEEHSSNRAATHDEVRAAVELWLETYEACSPYDGPCPVYSSPGEAHAMGLDLIPGIERHPLALAEYVLAPGQAPTTPPTTPKLPAPWTSWAFWQFAGDVQRYGGIVDLVLFSGSLDELLNL